jgi:hypothetical protein
MANEDIRGEVITIGCGRDAMLELRVLLKILIFDVGAGFAAFGLFVCGGREVMQVLNLRLEA